MSGSVWPNHARGSDDLDQHVTDDRLKRSLWPNQGRSVPPSLDTSGTPQVHRAVRGEDPLMTAAELRARLGFRETSGRQGRDEGEGQEHAHPQCSPVTGLDWSSNH